MHGWGRENDVANLTQTNEEDSGELESWRVGDWVNAGVQRHREEITRSPIRQVTD